MNKFEKHYERKPGKFFLEGGRVIYKEDKPLFYIKRWEGENSTFNITPCQCDAMAHFIIESLNNGNFDTYYKEYMKV